MAIEYYEKIEKLLGQNLSQKGFELWKTTDEKIPNIWQRPSSSTGKYHKKADGSQPTIAEHTYHMLYAAAKIMRMFNFKAKSSDGDVLLLAIVFHDCLKYGEKGNRPHTSSTHDKDAADMIARDRKLLLQILSADQVDNLIDGIRYHSGQWSTDVPGGKFSFRDGPSTSMFIHTLDMLSTSDLIQTDIRE